MIVELRNKEGDLILMVNPESKSFQVTIIDPSSCIATPFEVYFEHLEKFAIELMKATGHSLDPKEI